MKRATRTAAVAISVNFLVASTALAADTVNATTLHAPSIVPCAGDSCFSLKVRCGNDTLYPSRYSSTDTEADVLVRQRGTGTAGSVVLTTGGNGDSFYGDLTYAADIVDGLVSDDYRTFEVRWLPSSGAIAGGFVGGSEGAGNKGLCGAREVIEWISLNRRIGGTAMCGTGNSAGAMQFAYAIAKYGAGPYLKSVVYSAGPSWSDVFGACFGVEYNNGYSGTESQTLGLNTAPGRTYIETLFGLPAGSCAYGNPQNLDPSQLISLQVQSLVSYNVSVPASIEPRVYNPTTRQIFVRADHDYTGAYVQGQRHFDRVTGVKWSVTITDANDGTTNDFVEHGLDDTITGSARILEAIRNPDNCGP